MSSSSLSTEKISEVRVKLNSRSMADNYVGLEQTLRLLEHGVDVTEIFTDCIQLVVSKSIEIRRLSYAIITQLSSVHPDMALMATSVFQKDMSDRNQIVRAMALRAVTSLRVRDLSEATLHCIRMGVEDASPYVRKVACFGIAKVAEHEPETKEDLKELLAIALRDRVQTVFGAAIAAWLTTFPDSYDLIHPHFKDMCRLLIDTDEWGQTHIIGALQRYIRAHFTEPTSSSALSAHHREALDFVATLLRSHNSGVVSAACSCLFYCAPRDYPARASGHLAAALVRLSDSPDVETRYFSLNMIETMCREDIQMFSNYVLSFLPRSADPAPVSKLKLNVLTLLVNEASVNTVMVRLRSLLLCVPITACSAPAAHELHVSTVLQAISRIAGQHSGVRAAAVDLLVELTAVGDPFLSSEAICVLRHLAVAARSAGKPLESELSASIPRIIQLLPGLRGSTSIAAAADLVGLFAVDAAPALVPDAIRQLVARWPSLTASSKHAVILLAARLLIRGGDIVNGTVEGVRKIREKRGLEFTDSEVSTLSSRVQAVIQGCWERVIVFSSADESADVRSRCNTVRSFIEATTTSPVINITPQQTAMLDLLSEEPTEKPAEVPVAPEPQAALDASMLFLKHEAPTALVGGATSRFVLGSLSFVVNHPVLGYRQLPNWPAEELAKELRDVPSLISRPAAPAATVVSSTTVAPKASAAKYGSVSSDTFTTKHGEACAAAPSVSLNARPAVATPAPVAPMGAPAAPVAAPIAAPIAGGLDVFDQDAFWGDEPSVSSPPAAAQSVTPAVEAAPAQTTAPVTQTANDLLGLGGAAESTPQASSNALDNLLGL